MLMVIALSKFKMRLRAVGIFIVDKLDSASIISVVPIVGQV